MGSFTLRIYVQIATYIITACDSIIGIVKDNGLCIVNMLDLDFELSLLNDEATLHPPRRSRFVHSCTSELT